MTPEYNSETQFLHKPDMLHIPIDTKHVSDGHHTFGELYHYRMLYNAMAANLLAADAQFGQIEGFLSVCKSRKHSDGEYPFGDPNWFIVVMTLPTGQVSNHYRLEHWDLFSDVPEVELPPEYDGHNSQQAAERLFLFLMGPDYEFRP